MERFWTAHGQEKSEQLASLHDDSILQQPNPPEDEWTRLIIRETAWHLYALAKKEHGEGYYGATFTGETPPPCLETDAGPDPISIDEELLARIERECSMRSASTGKDALLHELLYGRMTPEEAEAEAKLRRWPPLETVPDPALSDPMKESHWSFTMAVAWIAWRTEDVVRKSWGKYCEARWLFVFEKWRIGFDGEHHKGWKLKQSTPSAARLGIAEAFHRSAGTDLPLMPVSEAITALWHKLGAGTLHATGVSEHTGNRQPFEAHEWQDLKLVEEREQDALTYVHGSKLGLVGYRLPTLLRTEVTAQWPNLTTPPAQPQPITRQETDAHYKSYVSCWPSTASTPSEADDLAHMKKSYPQITRERVRQLRDAHAPVNWRKPGRRKSS